MSKARWARFGAGLIVGALLCGQGAAIASTGSQNAGLKAAGYLKTQIHDDGGFGTQASTVSETSQAVIAIRTAGVKMPKSASGKTPVDYLKANTKDLANPANSVKAVGRIGQMIVALKFAGQDPQKFAGTDWLAVLDKTKEKATGWYGTTEIEHCWAMLALESVGQDVDSLSVNWLIGQQSDAGGFAFDNKEGQAGPDTNTTALAIQALIGAGEKPTSAPVKKALNWLKTQQNKDGGFPFVTPSAYGTDSDASSTAWVIQALLAANQDIEGKTWVKAAVTPMGFLMSLQNANGAFNYQSIVPGDSLIATYQAVPALVEKPLPYKAAAKPKPASSDKIDSSTTAWLLGGGVAVALLIALAGLYFGVMRKTA